MKLSRRFLFGVVVAAPAAVAAVITAPAPAKAKAIMGDAGLEAILPLSRTSSGSVYVPTRTEIRALVRTIDSRCEGEWRTASR